MKKTLLTLCCAGFAISACTMFPEYMRNGIENPYIDQPEQPEQAKTAQTWQANYELEPLPIALPQPVYPAYDKSATNPEAQARARAAYEAQQAAYAAKQAKRDAELKQSYHDRRAYNAKLDRILLLHPTTREMFSCSSNSLNDTGIVSEAVERCARNMEKEGFIRVTDIPRFTAPDDQHSHANYPSGRFRGVDPTPRW